jgi:Na+-translocating ferredoxin:NAD+ oxidoreductase subunit B
MSAFRVTVSADQIDGVLPQTQCRQCGFEGCRPYAQAISAGAAEINRCPPGGSITIARLAELTGLPIRALDPACGVKGPRTVAWIDPGLCIGCTKCIDACPVDAIIGASKWLHAVISDQCTGCELCVAPCPVDCIDLRECVPQIAWSDADAARAKQRHIARGVRLARIRERNDQRLAAKGLAVRVTAPPPARATPATTGVSAQARKRAIIDAAIERARARLETDRNKKPSRGLANK